MHEANPNREGVLQVDVTAQQDLVIGYQNEANAQSYHDKGFLTILFPDHPAPIAIPCAMLTTQGLINPQRYTVKARIPHGLS
jgi:hypothetical protein